MIREAIAKLTRKEDLTYEEARGVMEEMMDGTATQAQMGGLLMALSMQGETIDEITAFAEVMREKGVKIKPEREVIDIVGTGGDQVGTFNISTTSAFVVAAGGCRLQSMETAACPAGAERLMFLKSLAWKLHLLRSRMKKY